MCLRNTSTAYGSVAKFFHWVIAVLVIGMLIFGYFLSDFPEDMQGFVYNLHKLLGLLILVLMLLRLVWALLNPKPALPLGTPAWQGSAEKGTHFLLYLLTFMMPLSGWIGSDLEGRSPHLGSFQFTLNLPHNEVLAPSLFEVHGRTAYCLIALISLHVLAALYHHFIKKDNILLRMWPGRR